ncbi:MAG: sarcosine oxidase subunit beta [Glaciihabitans sp.]|nr:sarcosine oxidase subunit beta [Glaciihabitans sp.]
MTSQTSVVIIGGGIIGVSLSYMLSRNLELSVTVLEQEDAVAKGVTALGSGGFRQQFTTTEECLMATRTLDLWDQLQKDEGVDLELHHNGYLTLGSTATAAAVLVEHAEKQLALGIDVEVLDRAGVARALPGVRVDDIDVASITRRDGYGRPPFVAALLSSLAAKRGAQFQFGKTVNNITTSNGSVSGVVVGDAATGSSTIAADIVINAAGLDAPAIAAMVGLVLPIDAWRQHQFQTVPLDYVTADSFPCFLDPAHDLYFRPAGDAALVGYAESFDARRRDYTPNPTVVANARTQLAKRWPDAAAQDFVRSWVGCYEATPDRRAVIGAHTGVDGYYYAAGFSGHGLMNSLAAAEGIGSLIAGSTPDIDLSVFSADRFALADAPTTTSARTDTSW